MQSHQNNYRNMFVFGMILFPAGITTGLFPLWAFGFLLVSISLANRSKWKK